MQEDMRVRYSARQGVSHLWAQHRAPARVDQKLAAKDKRAESWGTSHTGKLLARRREALATVCARTIGAQANRGMQGPVREACSQAITSFSSHKASSGENTLRNKHERGAGCRVAPGLRVPEQGCTSAFAVCTPQPM